MLYTGRLPPVNRSAENSQETARRRSRGRPFKPGQSGNPGGRPKGSKTYAIRELVAQALTDPDTREAAIAEFRRALTRSETVIPAMEFAAKVNREIGPGGG
jgi:hypothetical protein